VPVIEKVHTKCYLLNKEVHMVCKHYFLMFSSHVEAIFYNPERLVNIEEIWKKHDERGLNLEFFQLGKRGS